MVKLSLILFVDGQCDGIISCKKERKKEMKAEKQREENPFLTKNIITATEVFRGE